MTEAILVACMAVMSLTAARLLVVASELSEALKLQCPHARMLGRRVMAKKYEASEWTPCVVVAVSLHGSMCLREAADMSMSGFWIKHDKVLERVREEGR